MPEANFVQHQREILHMFREATAQRKAKRQVADTTLNQVQQKANSQLAEARKAQDEAQVALREIGLQHLLEQTRLDQPTPHDGADPAQALAHSTSVATEAATAIPNTVEALQQQRERTAARQRLLMVSIIGVTLVFTVILIVSGFQGYRSWQAEQRRQQAYATATAEIQAQTTATAEVQATATAEARAAATAVATTLPLLDDWLDMTFVYVPPGDFIMGSLESEGDSDEHPQHTVYLNGFWIGSTEVTNAQYRPYVEAGGYRQQELWTEAGWAWRQSEGITHPRYWDDETWSQPDHPVVGVSWYEAVAFARWLAQETGLHVRLPTEAEWEKAARGTDGRRFPWGDDWDRDKANTDEGGPDRTTPVGAYPAGASPYGALDMAGNVWEWPQSLYEDYPYQPDDGRDEMEGSARRVVRGGSWDYSRRLARSANRSRYYPGIRGYYLGLRVVVAAPR